MIFLLRNFQNMTEDKDSKSKGSSGIETGSSRKECWRVRDAFFQCMKDKNDDRSQCTTEGMEYTHFI